MRDLVQEVGLIQLWEELGKEGLNGELELHSHPSVSPRSHEHAAPKQPRSGADGVVRVGDFARRSVVKSLMMALGPLLASSA